MTLSYTTPRPTSGRAVRISTLGQLHDSEEQCGHADFQLLTHSSIHSYLMGICDVAVTLFILNISTIFVFSFSCFAKNTEPAMIFNIDSR